LGYIGISEDNTKWQLEVKGQDVLGAFDKKYRQFLKETDVFCGVDLESGDFAVNYYDDFSDNHQWQEFLREDRWDDLRIAVAEVKGQDPVEVVFMSFVNDELFGETDEGWDFERLLGEVWVEIEDIVKAAIRIKNLAYQDGGETVSGDEVIQDVIAQGEDLMASISG
jgi:hypothetical protein